MKMPFNEITILSDADQLIGRLAGVMDCRASLEIRQALLARELAALCGKSLAEFFSDLAEQLPAPQDILLAHKVFRLAAACHSYTARQWAEWHGMLHGDDSRAWRAEQRFSDIAGIWAGEGPFLLRAGQMLCGMTALENELPGSQRTGQLLFSAGSVSAGIVPWPGLGFSPFLNATSADHIKLCRTAQMTGNPEKWMRYFLNGVARQSEDLISRITRIEALVGKWKTVAEGRSNRMAAKLIEGLAANPFLTAKGAAAELDAAFTTAQRAVDKLLRAGIVQETTNQRRDRIYCADEIRLILEEPPRVMNVSAWREEEKISEFEVSEEPRPARPPRHDPAANLPDVY